MNSRQDGVWSAASLHSGYNVPAHVVGGMFAIPQVLRQEQQTSCPQFLEGDPLLLTNARSGIITLVDSLHCRRVWMPSYLCPTMIRHLDLKRVSLSFYPVDGDLRVASLEWLSRLEERDLVVFIDYFGFAADEGIAAQAKSKGCWILNDACQALLGSQTLPSSDFVLYSPRKFVGVPDGGILASKGTHHFREVDLQPAPARWWLLNLEAGIRRREFDATGCQNDWFAWYQKGKNETPAGSFRMS